MTGAIPATAMTTASGRTVDLDHPLARDISFEDIAEHLSKIARYTGATPGVWFSVAQHCCEGVDIILAETGDEVLAAYFLLHDGHEYVHNDDPTPKKKLIAKRIATFCGKLSTSIESILAEPIEELDTAIHHAAGLAWPAPSAIAEKVKHYDRAMLATEWTAFMRVPPTPYVDMSLVRPIKLQPWPWIIARAAFIEHCDLLLPARSISARLAAKSGRD